MLSLEAMKAFDRLECSYSWYVLEVMGFGRTFINLVKTYQRGDNSANRESLMTVVNLTTHSVCLLLLTCHHVSPEAPLRKGVKSG